MRITVPTLTEETYYQDTFYMSNSRFKEYIDCPLRQQSIDLGFWRGRESTNALLLGNYVHSYFESEQAHAKFQEENGSELLSTRGTTKGQLKTSFKIADKMIKSLEQDELFNLFYHGSEDDLVEKESILTGEIAGIPFKAKVDSLNVSKGYFVDLKTMESIRKETYSPTLRQYTRQGIYNIIEYRYHMQMYIYQELLRQRYGYELTPYIAAVSKEPIPDKEIIWITDDILLSGKEFFEAHVDNIRDVFLNHTTPQGCGHCDFCLTHKKLTRSITLDELI